MADFPRKLDALMFRPPAHDAPPEFRIVDVLMVNSYRERGWILLAREDEIRFADIPDVRKADEDRGKRGL